MPGEHAKTGLIGNRIVVNGQVQGVGFRPFVYRLATSLGLHGSVCNAPEGVIIEVSGRPDILAEFRQRLTGEIPPQAKIGSVTTEEIAPNGYRGFRVIPSRETGEVTARITPDLATCPDCISEISDPNNRRYRYPFTNCTNCGPRFSIIENLPYDRKRTSMRIFQMCDKCREEYENPSDRRFHAQPNACSVCGPHLEVWDKSGSILVSHDEALSFAVEKIKQGKIVALKGLGGFQLLADARSEDTVRTLRIRKIRPDKPFALMYPSLEMIQRDCAVSEIEKMLLESAAAPIVLLKRKRNESNDVPCGNVAPGNPYLGVMLPYTPLHQLLMADLGFPIVATSGNRGGEPICIEEHQALSELGDIADFLLVHNRPIVRQVDDSVVRVVREQPLILRHARGYAPSVFDMDHGNDSMLAVGGHMKNSIAVLSKKKIVLGQYVGDLDSAGSREIFANNIESLTSIHKANIRRIVCDKHPDYYSTQYADDSGKPAYGVQHHYAHILSVMAEYGLEPPVLGVSWDGTGYGDDGTIWGGEFLRVDESGYERAAHLRTFPLPGGDKGIEEPRRCALGLLYERYGDDFIGHIPDSVRSGYSDDELRLIAQMLRNNINCPRTSSMGRLFDAVAALVGIRQKVTFEGQAAMDLEFAAENSGLNLEPYPVAYRNEDCTIADWGAMVNGILHDIGNNVNRNEIAGRFHSSMIMIAVDIAKRINIPKIVLSGGCFQNGLLLAGLSSRLEDEGFGVYWPHRLPVNDGGLAVGQILAAIREKGVK